MNKNDLIMASKVVNEEHINKIQKMIFSENMKKSLHSRLNKILNELANLNPSDNIEAFNFDNYIGEMLSKILQNVNDNKIVNALMLVEDLLDSEEYNTRKTKFDVSHILPLSPLAQKNEKIIEKLRSKRSKSEIVEETINSLKADYHDKIDNIDQNISEFREDLEQVKGELAQYISSRIEYLEREKAKAKKVKEVLESEKRRDDMEQIASSYLEEIEKINKRKNRMTNREHVILMNKFTDKVADIQEVDSATEMAENALDGISDNNSDNMEPQPSF